MTMTRIEAIEIVKDFISLHDNNHPVMVALKILIPELKTEDEIIKDEIINYFNCRSKEEPTRKEIHNNWIAWINKHSK